MTITDNLKNQIHAVQESGKYNMFDRYGVQREANEQGFYELVIFLEEHPDKYAEFILTGEQK